MGKALVAFATRKNGTKAIAQLITEGLRFGGVEATLFDISELEKNKIKLEEFDAIILGAPTYHGEMISTMKTFLFYAEKANLEGKVGGAFGAFGWSGEGAGRIFDTMKNVFKMDMVSGPLMLKSASLGGGLQMAQEYGRDIAKKLGGTA